MRRYFRPYERNMCAGGLKYSDQLVRRSFFRGPQYVSGGTVTVSLRPFPFEKPEKLYNMHINIFKSRIKFCKKRDFHLLTRNASYDKIVKLDMR